MKRDRNKANDVRLSHPKRHEDELPVYGNLAVTPKQMLEMSEKGIPISGQNLSMLPSDGSTNPGFDIPAEQLRGVDPAELWENSQIIKQRAKRAHDTDRKRFGDNIIGK